MNKLLSEDDTLLIQKALWEGVSRADLLIKFNIKPWTLGRCIAAFREQDPPGKRASWGKHYIVYPDGRVWSKRIYGWLKPYYDADGYATFGDINGESKLHRIVLLAFGYKPNEGEVVRHLDGDVSNNNLDNLMWGTPQQNQHDRVKMGRHYSFPNFGKKPFIFVTKTYGHELGLSACFRQWKADSHCAKWHGYPLKFAFTFACVELNDKNWVIDFGSLKPIKQWLEDTFDHKLLVAHDDPHLELIFSLEEKGLADVVIVQDTGCEAFARLAFHAIEDWLCKAGHSPKVWLQRVEVAEHGGNSVMYEPYTQ